ncbi:PTS mannitol transporter subunit IICBA [Enterococcus sp. AZ163]|uniref:PTS mannitol transporter subunit IICBA n=1 Tax=Enterococcus sp. AZ163 TaxID=2774638 RepID=UPI003D2C222E
MEMNIGEGSSSSGVLAKIRRFGGFMSGMVMPNLGAFVGWGIMAALFIPNGWLPNEQLNELVGPILNYVFPLLIGYTAGYNIHGQRGGVIGLFASMGVVVGSDITMISGAMIMGPLAAWVLKKFDQAIDGKIKPGFEMFVNNFSLGIIGAIFTIIAFLTVGPTIRGLVAILTAGVQWATDNRMIPALSIFMAPAQVLFLNNVVNHGILAPIGYAQAAELGKSIMFLVDTNNGPLLGTLFSIALFGKGKSKNTAPMAMFIAGIAGIGEVYFPFVLGNPIMVFATMGGLSVSLYLQVLLGGGLIGVASPGSLINIALMTPKDAIFANFVSILAGFIVSTLIGMFLLKTFGSGEEAKEYSVGNRKVKSVADFAKRSAKQTSLLKEMDAAVQKIVVACDSGMGSSAMGASVLKNLLKKENLAGITVLNSSANKIDSDADLVITLDSLIERAKISGANDQIAYIPINNFLKESDYDEAIAFVKERNQHAQVEKISEAPEAAAIIDGKILNEENILLNQSFANVEEAIVVSGQILVDKGYVTKDYIDQMIERNQRLPVYVGNHVAIPHGLEESRGAIKESGVSVVQVPEGVAFPDGEIAYVFIGIAGKNNSHLEILSVITSSLIDEENVQRIRRATTAKEIMDVFAK